MSAGLKSILIMAISFSVFVGCGSNTNSSSVNASNTRVPQELQPIYDEIMAAHDEVMPRMSELTNLQNRLVVVLDTLRNRTPLQADQLKEANRILGRLNQAENAMWDWMHGFGKLDSVPTAHKEVFLLSEKSSVLSMRELMLESLDGASEYLENQNIISE